MYKDLLCSLKFWSLFAPFISTYMIVLNVYNGDILGVHENIEYAIWYTIPFICNIYEGKALPQVFVDCAIRGSCCTAWRPHPCLKLASYT